MLNKRIMKLFVLFPSVFGLALTVSGLVESLQTEDTVATRLTRSHNSSSSEASTILSSIESHNSTSVQPSIVGNNTSVTTQVSSPASVKPANGTTKIQVAQNATSSSENSDTSVDTSVTKTTESSLLSSFTFTFTKSSVEPTPSHSNESLYTQSQEMTETHLTTSFPNASWVDINGTVNITRHIETAGSEGVLEKSSGVYYFEVIIIGVSIIAVIVIAVYVTKQFTNKGFKRRFGTSNRRDTIGKRYSDISLQLLNRESGLGLLDLPNFPEEQESHIVPGKAEVVNGILQEVGFSDPPTLFEASENGSPKSADGVWL